MKEDDKIKQLFKSELGQYPSPIPVNGWDKISSSLDSISVAKKKKRLHRRVYMYTSAIAASIICFVFVASNLLRNNGSSNLMDGLEVHAEKNDDVEIRHSSILQPDELLGSNQLELADNNLLEERTLSSDSEDTDKINVIKDKQQQVAALENLAYLYAELKVAPRISSVNLSIENKSKLPMLKSKSKSKSKSMNTLSQASLFADNRDDFRYKTKRSKPKRNIITIEGTGSSGSYSQEVNRVQTLFRSTSSTNSNDFAESREKFVARTKYNQDGMSKTKIKHSLPLNFGLTLTHDIGLQMSLTSGLEYSYLHSYIHTYGETIERNEEQSMHYVGIPLLLNYNIIDKKQFRLFFLAGGKIEKNVYAKRKEVGEIEKRDYVSISNVYFSNEFRESGFKYSVSSGVGVSMPIFNRIHLYGRVGGSYYFRSVSEYKTIYSEKPFNLNLTVGINISL